MNTKRKSKTKKRIFTLLAVIIVIAGAAFVMPRLLPKTAAYESVEAKNGDIKTYYSFSGNVEAKNRQSVIAEKVMQISEINVKEGEQVKKEDVLFTTTTGDEITAKIDGEVSRIDIEENEQVMAGIVLMEIVDYKNLQVNIKLDEYSIPALEVGKDATVYMNAIDKEIKGSINSISKEGQVVNGVTYFTAVIDLDKNKAIKVGMSAEVKFLSESVSNVVTIPMYAVQFDDDNKPFVYLKDENDKYIKTDIKTGINDGTSVEVESGVKSKEVIYYKKVTASSNNDGFGPGNQGGM